MKQELNELNLKIQQLEQKYINGLFDNGIDKNNLKRLKDEVVLSLYDEKDINNKPLFSNELKREYEAIKRISLYDDKITKIKKTQLELDTLKIEIDYLKRKFEIMLLGD